MSVELTEPVEARLALIFSGAEVDEARRLLRDDCAADVTEHGVLLERIRIAALKLSDGALDRLVEAIVLAQTDWRDALVAAGFGDDVHAHEAWWPR